MSCGGTTKKMQDGGPIQLRSLRGQKKDTTSKPVDYSKIGTGLLLKGTIVDSKYRRDKKLKESKLNNKMQNGGITKDGQKIKFPPIVKKEAAQESAQPTKLTAFEKRQNKKIARAKTKSAVASIEGEGSVSQKKNNRAGRISRMLGTDRMKVPKTLSTSTTTNTSINSNNTSSGSSSDSGSTSSSKSGSSSGSSSEISNSGNSKNANETNNNSKNKKYQKGGATGAKFPKSAKYEQYTIDSILKKKFIKRPVPKKPKVTKSSSSLVIGSGNSNNNNSINNNSNNKKIVITKKDNSINKSTNSRNRYQKGGSTSSVIGSGNSSNRNTVNNNSNNTKIYKKKVDNSINKSTNSRNTRIEKAKQKNVKVDRNRPIGGTYPFTFK
jgi:hypothetical protein